PPPRAGEGVSSLASLLPPPPPAGVGWGGGHRSRGRTPSATLPTAQDPTSGPRPGTDAVTPRPVFGEQPAGPIAAGRIALRPIAAEAAPTAAPTGERGGCCRSAVRRDPSVDAQLLELVAQRAEGDAQGGRGLGLVVAVFLQGLLDGGALDLLDV